MFVRLNTRLKTQMFSRTITFSFISTNRSQPQPFRSYFNKNVK